MSKKIDIKGIVIKTAATGVGAVGAAKLSGMLGARVTPFMKGIINVVAGAFIPKVGKNMGKNGGAINEFASGFTAVGSLQLANQTLFKNNQVTISGVGELATLGGDYDQIVSGFPTMVGEADTDGNPYTA